MPLSGAAIQLILYLYAALRQVLYGRREDVYVAADQFIYHKPHDPRVKIAPDVWVCYGVPRRLEREVLHLGRGGDTQLCNGGILERQS